MDDSLNSWFKREILPHEEALMRYLHRIWPGSVEIADLRQETYARVYESSRSARPLTARAFLFATARNLVIDRIRRERVVSIEAVPDVDTLNVLIEEISPERRTIARQELKRLAHAFDLLPPKCREVVWLRRVLDVSQKEVASKLGIGERTVEKHVAKGARLLAEYMLSGDLPESSTPLGVENVDEEYESGKHQRD